MDSHTTDLLAAAQPALYSDIIAIRTQTKPTKPPTSKSHSLQDLSRNRIPSNISKNRPHSASCQDIEDIPTFNKFNPLDMPLLCSEGNAQTPTKRQRESYGTPPDIDNKKLKPSSTPITSNVTYCTEEGFSDPVTKSGKVPRNKTTKQHETKPNYQHTVILDSIPTNILYSEKEVVKNLRIAVPRIQILNFRKGYKSSIVIHPATEGDQNKLLSTNWETTKAFEGKATCKLPGTSNPRGPTLRLICKGISTEYSEEDIADEIQENQGIMAAAKRYTRSDGQMLRTVELTVYAQEDQNELQQRGVQIGFRYFKAEPKMTANALLCSKCWKAGHSSFKCVQSVICPLCSIEGHSKNKCNLIKGDTLTCANCGDNHPAYSSMCRLRRQQISEYLDHISSMDESQLPEISNEIVHVPDESASSREDTNQPAPSTFSGQETRASHKTSQSVKQRNHAANPSWYKESTEREVRQVEPPVSTYYFKGQQNDSSSLNDQPTTSAETVPTRQCEENNLSWGTPNQDSLLLARVVNLEQQVARNCQTIHNLEKLITQDLMGKLDLCIQNSDYHMHAIHRKMDTIYQKLQNRIDQLMLKDGF